MDIYLGERTREYKAYRERRVEGERVEAAGESTGQVTSPASPLKGHGERFGEGEF